MSFLSRWRRSPAERVESGLALMDKRAFDDASEEFLRAARGEDPEITARAWLLLGGARLRAGDRAGAAEYLRYAVASDHPEYAPRALLDLADADRAEGRFEPVLQAAIESGHTDVAPRAALELGTVLKQRGDDAAAEPVLRVAVESRHLDAAPRAMLVLAELRRRAGARDEADELCRRARDAGPRDVARRAREMLAADSEPAACAPATARRSRRGPAQGTVCDFCSGGPVVGTYTASDLRAAVRHGFQPDFGPMAAMAGALDVNLDEDVFRGRWLVRVSHDDTPWASCGQCATRVDGHLS